MKKTAKKTKPLHDLLEKIAAPEWLTFANAQREKIIKEVEHLGKEMLAKVDESPIFAHREQLLKEVRQHLEELLQRLQHSELLTKMHHVLAAARHGKDDLLGLLNIPTKRDLSQLQRKLSKIEARLEGLDHRSVQ